MIAGTGEAERRRPARTTAAPRCPPARGHQAAARVARRDPRGHGHRGRLRAPGQALPEPLGGRPRRSPAASGPGRCSSACARPGAAHEPARRQAQGPLRGLHAESPSEEGLEQEFNSLDAQRAAGEAYIASQSAEGWLLVPDRYDDGGFSGATLERPALKRLLADVEAGRIDCRRRLQGRSGLSRSLTDFAKLVEVFEQPRRRPSSRVTQAVLHHDLDGQADAQHPASASPNSSARSIGERIRDKFAASRAKGMWMGGSPPLGYDVRDRKLVVNPAEAELVRLIFRRFLDLGSALLLIRELNAQGHRTKSWTTQAGTFREGRPFDKGTLYKILRNRTYLGEAVHKGRSYPGEHEPIVDRATWDRVHEVLASNAKRRGNEARARTPAPLRGLMRCTHCSSAMTPTHTRRRGRWYRYCVYLGASRRGHDTCPMRSIAASDVEGLVLGRVRRLLASPELVARIITPVHRENGAAENAGLRWACHRNFGALEPVWDELYPAEQARILRLLIERSTSRRTASPSRCVLPEIQPGRELAGPGTSAPAASEP